jgi:hypothetical protein
VLHGRRLEAGAQLLHLLLQRVRPQQHLVVASSCEMLPLPVFPLPVSIPKQLISVK